MAQWSRLIAAASAGVVPLALLVHPFVGSGRSCEGVGFGCAPERATDTLLVVGVYAATAMATLALAWWRARRGRPWRTVLCAGIAICVSATAVTVWSQLPRRAVSPGPLSAARERWERVIADGRAVAAPGTPLGNALRALQRTGPVPCRDAYGRSTGARQVRWSCRGEHAYAGTSDGSGAITAAALGRWADRLRRRGERVTLSDPSGDPASDRRLQVGDHGPAAGGVLDVRASFYISELEVTASTGCHRG
jgi:hypothetical protein